MPRKREDQPYLDWLSFQSSWLDGKYSEWDETKGMWRNIACHVSRANNHGIAIKAIYSAVPMTFKQHHIQSTKGELACIMQYAPDILFYAKGETDEERAKFAFDSSAAHHLNTWRLYQ